MTAGVGDFAGKFRIGKTNHTRRGAPGPGDQTLAPCPAIARDRSPPFGGRGRLSGSAAALLIQSHAFLLRLRFHPAVQPRCAAIQPLNVREGVT